MEQIKRWSFVAVLGIGKFLAAAGTGKLFNYSTTDWKLVFSITIPQMAATLASAVVGYQTQNSAGERLLDAQFVNAVLVLVVVTCVIGPILTEYWGKQLSADTPKPQAV